MFPYQPLGLVEHSNKPATDTLRCLEAGDVQACAQAVQDPTERARIAAMLAATQPVDQHPRTGSMPPVTGTIEVKPPPATEP